MTQETVGSLIAVVAGAVFAACCWLWDMPINASIYESFSGHAPEPGGRMDKGLGLSRWVGIAFGGFFIVVGVLGLFRATF
jgi:threonine/homoserine/homoserine lactone efflux protein